MIRVSLALASLAVVSAVAEPPRQREASTVADIVACAQAVLGGSDRLGAVHALRLTADIGPAPGSIGVQPGRREDVLVLPDQYKTTTRSVSLLPDGTRSELPAIVQGFSGSVLLSSVGAAPAPGDPTAALAVARHSMARLLLSLLIRTSSMLGTVLALAPTESTAHTVIRAQGTDGVHAALILDAASCQPLAVEWERPASRSDLLREARAKDRRSSVATLMAELGPVSGMRTVRMELSEYRVVDGIRFPTRWVTSIGTLPDRDTHVVELQVNPPIPATEFTVPWPSVN